MQVRCIMSFKDAAVNIVFKYDEGIELVAVYHFLALLVLCPCSMMWTAETHKGKNKHGDAS